MERWQDRLAATLDDPKTGRAAAWLVLALLMWIAFLVRYTIVIDGALDTDVINFGLAAFRFDVLDHQPHPPGYPGYVLILKVIHLLFPSLGPLEVATWGCRATGVLTIPAAYWACRQALDVPSRRDPRPFAAAALAVVHPLLWYYGGDGQSHDVEAMATLLLFGGALWVRRTGRGRLVLVAACALAGSLRPTISLLAAPMLLWTFWRRPLRDWIAATAVGMVFVAAWTVPLIGLTGGWDLYRRAENALIGDLFIANFSVFGARARKVFVIANLVTTSWAFLEAIIPIVSLGGRRGSWMRPFWLTLAANYVFYALVYCSEPGYLTGVAALACLVPATWPDRLPVGAVLRGALAWIACAAFMLLGPANLPLLFRSSAVFAPTLAHVAAIEAFQHRYREQTCVSPDGAPALVVTDNPTTTHTRLLPILCPGFVLGLYIHHNPLNPAFDNWLLFYADGMDTLPTEIPLEIRSGPGAEATLRAPVGWVLRASDASEEVDRWLEQSAVCPSLPAPPAGSDEPRFWPARCLPTLHFGANVVHVPAL